MKSATKNENRPYRKLFQISALSAVLLTAGLSLPATAQYGPPDNQQYPQGQETNPSSRVGRLAYLQGNVSFEPNGVNAWNQAEPNYPVATGDRVYTDPSARAEVSIGSMVARISGGTDLTVTNLTDQIVQLGLAQGSLRVRAYEMPAGNQIEVDTPNGAITLNQPGDIRIDVPADANGQSQGATVLTVNEGNVEVSGPNVSENVGRGNAVELTGTNPMYLNAIAFPHFDQFDEWSISRDRHILNARSAAYVSRDMPGFDDLDDYGSWQPDTEYGPVWYPRDVDAGYVPYQNGHWIWVDPYGWTWVDAAPWGYAPFHYGRWAYIDSRWGWVPGPVRVRPYWAPALVAFAGGGGAGFAFGGGVGFAAWFPLGVAEPYVPSYHCGPSYIRNVNVTNINVTVIHNTTIVNNYNTFVHNTNNFTNIHNNVAIAYQNRERGFTAVNGRAFTAGQPVRNNIARVPPQAIQASTVIAHPSLIPTRQSLVPRPAPAPVPVNAARPTLLTRTGKEQQAAPGARPVAVPYRPLPPNQQRPVLQSGVAPGARPGTPAPLPGRSPVSPVAQPAQPGRPIPPPAAGNLPAPGRPGAPAPGRLQPPVTQTPVARPAPAPIGRPQAPEPVGRLPVPQPSRPVYTPAPQRPLINRSSPPVPQPTFQQQRPAFKSDPGRPLEPQQRENLRQGMPAGRPQDQEALPHAQPMRQAAPPPRPQAPAPRPQPEARPQPAPRPQPEARPQPQARPIPPPRENKHR